MKTSQAAQIWLDYHMTHSKKNTVRSYRVVIDRLCQYHGDDDIDQITSDQILAFLNQFTEGNKSYTKRIRFSQLQSSKKHYRIFTLCESLPNHQ